MTEDVRRPRASKRELRAWAWVAGALAFLAPAAVFGATPKPRQDTAQATDRPDLVIRRITRRIVITRPAVSSPVRYVAGGSTSGSSSVSSAPAATSTGGS
jgi:hypothetical protein